MSDRTLYQRLTTAKFARDESAHTIALFVWEQAAACGQRVTAEGTVHKDKDGVWVIDSWSFAPVGTP